MAAADNLMADARSLVKRLDIGAEQGFLHITKLDVRCAMYLVKKRAPGDRAFGCVADIAQVSSHATFRVLLVSLPPCFSPSNVAAATLQRGLPP